MCPPRVATLARSEPAPSVSNVGVSVCGGRRPGPYSAGCPGCSEKLEPRSCRATPNPGTNRIEPQPTKFDCSIDTAMRCSSTTLMATVPPGTAEGGDAGARSPEVDARG